MDSLNNLQAAFPSCEAHITELGRLRTAIEAVPLVEFFEPKIAISHSVGTPGELLSLGAETLTSWAAHVSFGSRVRMRSLEDACIGELLQRRLFPAMAMVRPHMESAAFETYGLQRVGACADAESRED